MRGSHTSSVRVAAIIAFGLVTAAVAQQALDRNLSASGSRNAPAQNPLANMSKPVYTVNRNTGEFQYNRANAFNDDTYNIYQRYTRGPFDAPGVGTSGVRTTPRRSDVHTNPRQRMPTGYTPPASRRAPALGAKPYRPGGSAHVNAHRAGAGRASAGRAGGMRAPTYRVNSGRVR
ncbi:MAG: hypothetical protein AAGG07_03325 [Planctomycetota bacterium]